jgi:hypothetical protein
MTYSETGLKNSGFTTFSIFEHYELEAYQTGLPRVRWVSMQQKHNGEVLPLSLRL